MAQRLAIFDCDGTLVDSQHNICRAMETCFAAAGLDPPEAARTRQVVGLSLTEAMRELLPEAETDFHEELATLYREAFTEMRRRGLPEEPLFEGVRPLVESLASDGWLLGIATGKSDRGVQLCLAGHDIASHFVTIQTADRHPSKPHPSMIDAALAETGLEADAAVMIGDTSYDMEMGRAARVRAIGVAWGYHSPDRLMAAGADFVARHPRELVPLLEERLR